MRSLEISNVDEIRPHLSMVNFSTRVLPSLIIFSATSLVVLFLTYFIIVIAQFSTASWNVCKSNQRLDPTTQDDPKIATVPEEPGPAELNQRQPPLNPGYPVLDGDIAEYKHKD